MTKTILKTECPYCGCKDLKPIGVQDGIKADIFLANCTNVKCEPYTIVVAKVVKFIPKNV